MANEDHLKLIKEAVEKKDITIWNQWRRENADVRMDLSHADLSGANLSGADLFEVDLLGANLLFANLSGANLLFANLSEANLIGTNLLGARLLFANLLGANILRADLRDVKALFPSQIKTAKNWDTAFYSQEIIESLGLPADHNEKFGKNLEVERPKE